MRSGLAAGLDVEVVDGLTPLWPELAVGAPLLATPGWLRAMDGRLGGRPVTVVVRRDGRATLAAFATVQTEPRPGELFDVHHAVVHPGELPLTPTARAARERLAAAAPPPSRWLPCLLLMLPGYECAPVGPGADDPAAADALVDGALRWAAARGIATVAALYTRPGAVTLTGALVARGFVGVPLMPAWELRLPGTGLPDHLATLPSKRRVEARRELRVLAEAGVRIEQVDADDVFDDLVRLRRGLVRKYRGADDPDAERTKLRRIVDDVAGGHPHVLLATAGSGAVLGFALFAEHGGGWHCLALGSDYDDPRSRLTYFATAYYRAAELAYSCGVRTIGYGLGAWRAKRARGCQPVPLTGWVHTTDTTLTPTLRTTARITHLSL